MGPIGPVSGHSVLITGAASGIGKACAFAFAASGATVVLADIDDRRCRRVRDEMAAAGYVVSSVHVDVTDREACRSMVREAAGRMGRLDTLVNNAISYGPSGQHDRDTGWDATLESGLSAVWAASMEAAPLLADSGRGSIVNIASVAGARFGFSTAGYSAAKAGVVGLTRWIAKELGPRGIRANCICPGLIETPLWHIDGEPYPRRFRNWVAMTPLGRAGKPEEVASLAVFLAGEGAAFINGQDIAVDGGFCVGMRFEDMETD